MPGQQQCRDDPARRPDDMRRIAASICRKLALPAGAVRAVETCRGGVNDVFKLLLADDPQPYALRVRRVFFPEQSDSRFAKDALCAFLSSPQRRGSMVEIDGWNRFLAQMEGESLPFPLSAPIRLFEHASGTRGPPAWSLSLWIDGEPLSAWPEPEHYRALGRALHALHGTRFGAFHPELDQPARTMRWSAWYRFMIGNFARDGLAAAIGADALARLRRLEPQVEPDRFVLTHGDLHPANALLSPSGVRLIDWDEAGVNIAEHDCVLIRYGTRLDGAGNPVPDETLFGEFLRGYAEQGGGLSPLLLDLSELLFLLKRSCLPPGAGASGLPSGSLAARIVELTDRLSA